ncbi:MAG: class I tRNA ligase family protein, partial [Patescibacteria group bacterium]
IEKGGKTYRRDPDVFDTWFTSSSWPYATMSADDQKQFYPNSLMETGGEILQPWVSRMIMLGLYVKGEVPFKEVYIHGYVMAEDGSKMSKSIGNVIDPLPVIEKYGSDALRMGLISGRSAGVNRGFDSRRVEEARNFCNKIWNIARFIEDKLDEKPLKSFSAKPETEADHWILHKLAATTTAIDEYMGDYRLSEAYDRLYHFVWDDFADWYIEASKTAQNASILAHTLSSVLKIAHPFAPFLTETIWQTLHPDKDSLLISQDWPKNHDYSKGKAKDFEKVQKIVAEIRHIKTSLQIKKGGLYYTSAPFVSAQSELIKSLAKLEDVQQVKDGRGLMLISVEEKCWLNVDYDSVEKFNEQLGSQLADIEKQIKLLESRLGNENYVKKAPKELVDESNAKLAELKTEKSIISTQLEHYRGNKL